ncbi:MAG: tRNA (guanosine(37)-N1)-methyltransferase TrmD [Acidimicrobiia bacterium]
MRIDLFSIFPGYFEGPFESSLLGRAREAGIVDLRVHDPRDHADDRHRTVDDTPYGGGAGMVMMPGPLFASFEATDALRPVLLLSAGGRRFDQSVARELADLDGFSLICGRYEGVDQRVADHLCDGELSVGDYVLAGGEAAALVVVDAVTRLVPGVMGNDGSGTEESFSAGLVEYPQYTRPAEFRGHAVPEVLRGGDHARIARWRRATALRRTMKHRPDLLAGRPLDDEDDAVLREFPPDAADA